MIYKLMNSLEETDRKDLIMKKKKKKEFAGMIQKSTVFPKEV